MSIHNTLAASAAIAISLAAGAASAATVNVERQHVDSLFSFTKPTMPVLTSMQLEGSNLVSAQIGGYANTADDGTTSWDFVGWCIDLFTPYVHGGATDLTVGQYTTSTPDPAPTDNLSKVLDFFRAVYEPATIPLDPILAAGWQLAIWEILYETEETYSLTGGATSGGSFYGVVSTRDYGAATTSGTVQEAAFAAADSFLAAWAISTTSTEWDFTLFASGNNQDLLSVTPPSEVPLPMPALLLLGGLAALGTMKRRGA